MADTIPIPGGLKIECDCGWNVVRTLSQAGFFEGVRDKNHDGETEAMIFTACIMKEICDHVDQNPTHVVSIRSAYVPV